MQGTMSTASFRNYLEKHTPSKIIFDTDNQNWTYSPLRFHLTFTQIDVILTPDQIYLTGELQKAGNICMQQVKRIRVNENDVYTAATVVCGTADKEVENSFRLLLYP